MKTALRLFAVLAAAASLSACNTIQGVGRDIQTAGEKLEEATQ